VTGQGWQARVVVRLGSGVNDPQGNTVRDGLHRLGHLDVRDVRVGKVIDLVIDAADAAEARGRLEAMCRELLANPVIETYSIDLVGAET
jgi:phosphoribosylformylglycinamidine synthase